MDGWGDPFAHTRTQIIDTHRHTHMHSESVAHLLVSAGDESRKGSSGVDRSKGPLPLSFPLDSSCGGVDVGSRSSFCEMRAEGFRTPMSVLWDTRADGPDGAGGAGMLARSSRVRSAGRMALLFSAAGLVMVVMNLARAG